jgi:hypothetical protein
MSADLDLLHLRIDTVCGVMLSLFHSHSLTCGPKVMGVWIMLFRGSHLSMLGMTIEINGLGHLILFLIFSEVGPRQKAKH